ncbi:hypothetical protein CcNV_036 [Crangon crangon nudivirus]|uniref:Uncharacterized protein n=1 Tax=Crangon crangon nudivirus TaxID=2880838 RepID=A0AAE8Y048_9VIRU|nr:hypothetical protein QKT25_gp036 [Crangon crangon nudivirus]UBZ25520.1 hypothetical protein CcNV_036 [Crangon crangon nudivirus]
MTTKDNNNYAFVAYNNPHIVPLTVLDKVKENEEGTCDFSKVENMKCPLVVEESADTNNINNIISVVRNPIPIPIKQEHSTYVVCNRLRNVTYY